MLSRLFDNYSADTEITAPTAANTKETEVIGDHGVEVIVVEDRIVGVTEDRIVGVIAGREVDVVADRAAKVVAHREVEFIEGQRNAAIDRGSTTDVEMATIKPAISHVNTGLNINILHLIFIIIYKLELLKT